MQTTTRYLAIIGLVLLIRCGGQAGGLADAAKQIVFDFGDPVADFSLSDGDYAYRMALYYDAQGVPGDLIFGPAEVNSYNADDHLYYTRIDNILDGTYILKITLVKDVSGESYADASATGYLDLSAFETSVTVHGAINDVDLSTAEWQSGGFDDDEDSLTNLEEVGLGTLPLSPDTDGDGVNDGVDDFPFNPEEWSDFDADGFGDNHDDDLDNDGLSNAEESALGTDVINPDTDGDSVGDGVDNCPTNKNSSQADVDADAQGDECDTDMDGDGLANATEVTLGTNTRLVDTDGDGVSDFTDVFPLNNAEAADNDADGSGDASDLDDDNDGIADTIENLLGSNAKAADSDGDGVSDSVDNCLLLANAGQANNDADTSGDDCDTDDDNDDLSDAEEAVIGTDGFITNRLLADSDGDGFVDDTDNCPLSDNLDQDDADMDGFGSACDCADLDLAIHQLAEDHPDNRRIDSNCDGIDGDKYKAVFVAAAGVVPADMSDAGDPTSDLNGAVAYANEKGWDVYVAEGDYNIASLILADGVDLYGGFSSDYLERDLTGTVYPARLAHPSGDANGSALTIAGFVNETVLAGFVLENHATTDNQSVIRIEDSHVVLENNVISGNGGIDAETLILVSDSTVRISGNRVYGEAGYDSVGLSLTRSSGMIVNNVFNMGDAEHTLGLSFDESSGVIVNNTIDGGRHTTGFAFGVSLTSSNPEIINNIIITQNDRNQASVVCDGPILAKPVTLENNLFVRLTTREITYSAYVTCDGTQILSDVDLVEAREVRAKENIFFSEMAISALNTILDPDADYTLATESVAIDAGQDTDDERLGMVIFDINGKARTPESYDIGAVEF